MRSENSANNFARLGRRLKTMRTNSRESLAETAGAVEIEVRELANYEIGRQRPSEDVLLLLISHFGVKDEEAVKLWEEAGYHLEKDVPDVNTAKETHDNRILFTDVVDIIVNNYGVVMNFAQSSGPNSSPVNVARVGMSREHAKSVLKILQMTLAQTEKSPQISRDKPGSPDSLTNPN